MAEAAIQIHQLRTHRVIDAQGHFYCASDRSDCERLAKSIPGGPGKVELNENPIWVNHANSGWYTGPDTVQYLYGHPLTEAERQAIQHQRDHAHQPVAAVTAQSPSSTPITIKRAPYKGHAEAVPGLRVWLMIQGDRSGRTCFARRAEGVIESVGPYLGRPGMVIRFDEPQPYVGDRIRAWSHEVTALDEA